MSRVAKKQIKVIIPAFRSLVRSIATQLTTNLNTFIAHLDEKKTEEKGVKRKKGDKDKVIAPKMDRSARSIPALTYASEQYNQAILGVTKRTKEDLSFGSKLGTTRDFRIKADKVNVRQNSPLFFKLILFFLYNIFFYIYYRTDRKHWKVMLRNQHRNQRSRRMTKSKQPTAGIDQGSTKAAEGVQQDALEEEDVENSHLLARLMLPNNFLYICTFSCASQYFKLSSDFLLFSPILFCGNFLVSPTRRIYIFINRSFITQFIWIFL
jgi:hypothetical protein